MLQEAIEQITDMAVEAAGPKIVAIPGDPTRLLVNANGKCEMHVLPPAHRKHTVRTLDDMVLITERASGVWGGKPVLWHDRASVVLVVDDGERRDVVTMPLQIAETYATVEKLAARKFTQKEFVQLLRVSLRGCVVDPTLLPAVRELKFKKNASGTSGIQHGRESMGREIESEIVGADAIPEEVVLQTRVYNNPDVQYMAKVTCALDIDLESESFTLRPMPDQLEEAVQGAQNEVRTRLEEIKDVQSFYGTP